MRVVANANEETILRALTELTAGASAISLAVSYVQTSGWALLRDATKHVESSSIRLVCTDQFAITQPAAIRTALKEGVRVRLYDGSVTYHPKLYLAYDKRRKPLRYLIGSANLSESAFITSEELGWIGDDSASLDACSAWFEKLFVKRAVEPSEERLQHMEDAWKTAAAARATIKLKARKERQLLATVSPPAVSPTPDEVDSIDDVFATLDAPLGLLNFDHAGNNVRNLSQAANILVKWSKGRPVSDKQRSEMRLLGFANDGKLTPLGREAAASNSLSELAELWCAWLAKQTDNSLFDHNRSRLVAARKALSKFWQLDPGVRQFFLENAENPAASIRETLKTIELLCNASPVAAELRLPEIETLTPLLRDFDSLPERTGAIVKDYLTNKGTRSWETPDRVIIPRTWRKVTAFD